MEKQILGFRLLLLLVWWTEELEERSRASCLFLGPLLLRLLLLVQFQLLVMLMADALTVQPPVVLVVRKFAGRECWHVKSEE